MKPTPFFASRLLAGAAIILSSAVLISWDHQQVPHRQENRTDLDTIPREKKIRDLDESLDQLDRIDIDAHISKAMESVAEVMKNIDAEKLHLEAQKALAQVDMEKVKRDVHEAMKNIDMEKIKADVNVSLAKIDWDEIQKEIKKVQSIDMKELQKELNEVTIEIQKIQPQLKEELARARVEIEKAKKEIKEYKDFVDGLDKDGLLNKKEDYTIRNDNGKLIVNGKEAPSAVYEKYRKFLDKHTDLNIKKSENSFDVDID